MSALARTFADSHLRLPGGESSFDARARARAAFDDALMDPQTQPVALFTHGNLLALLAQSFDPTHGFEFWAQLKNPDVFEVHSKDDKAVIRRRVGPTDLP